MFVILSAPSPNPSCFKNFILCTFSTQTLDAEFDRRGEEFDHHISGSDRLPVAVLVTQEQTVRFADKKDQIDAKR